ncbi:MAG: hypothetical protein KC766_06270 [Myxococcales bacterium]|nr:hypothetical protein [Myxococcales bacterium]
MTERHGTIATLDRLLGDAEALLKERHGVAELARRGLNASIALIAVQGLRAYFEGRTRQAVDDLSTAADELRARNQA